MENIVRVSIVIEARVEIWENDKLKRQLELKGSAIFVVISRKRLTIVYLCLSVHIYIYIYIYIYQSIYLLYLIYSFFYFCYKIIRKNK